MALPRYLEVESSVFKGEDFYDKMTPKWSNAMAKQYNKDTDEHMKSITKEIQDYEPSDNDITESKINPAHYKDVAYGYQYIQLMIPMLYLVS